MSEVRAIDADALRVYNEYVDGDGGYVDIVYKRDLDAAPTIDPERHASWEYRAYDDDEGERRFVASCTKCGQIRVAGIGLANYCPNCGARMDAEEGKDG